MRTLLFAVVALVGTAASAWAAASNRQEITFAEGKAKVLADIKAFKGASSNQKARARAALDEMERRHRRGEPFFYTDTPYLRIGAWKPGLPWWAHPFMHVRSLRHSTEEAPTLVVRKPLASGQLREYQENFYSDGRAIELLAIRTRSAPVQTRKLPRLVLKAGPEELRVEANRAFQTVRDYLGFGTKTPPRFMRQGMATLRKLLSSDDLRVEADSIVLGRVLISSDKESGLRAWAWKGSRVGFDYLDPKTGRFLARGFELALHPDGSTGGYYLARPRKKGDPFGIHEVHISPGKGIIGDLRNRELFYGPLIPETFARPASRLVAKVPD